MDEHSRRPMGDLTRRFNFHPVPKVNWLEAAYGGLLFCGFLVAIWSVAAMSPLFLRWLFGF